MGLVIGTRDGLFLAPDVQFDGAEQALDCGHVMRVRRFEEPRGVFAATKTGLYHSAQGEQWSDLGVPLEEVYSVLVSPDGERIYAGTHPAHIYASANNARSWRELLGFQELPSRSEWHTPRHRNEAHVRSLGAHPDAPDRIVAGVEVGGVHVSEDGGERWTERKEGVHNDVHHVLVLGPDEYVASCGGGLYRTRDAGESWTRLDEDLDHTYFREAFSHDGTLYAAAARGPPGTWEGENGVDAALFESADDGDSFERASYDGEPEEFVLAWTEVDGNVVAGTNEGRVLVREADGWTTAGTVPAGISSLCPL